MLKNGVVAVLMVGGLLVVCGCASTTRVPAASNHIILVGHGGPASDYPKDRLAEYFRTHHAEEKAELAQEIRDWPRTPDNDPYKFGVDALAERLSAASGHQVIVAYNEFCTPTLEEAVEQVVRAGARRIVVIPTMLTPGGSHSEKDIPRGVAAVRERFPNVEIVYAWPFDLDRIAGLLADQVTRFGTVPQS